VILGCAVAIAGALLDIETAIPPLGAAAVSVIVPVELAPLMTDVGFKLRAEIATVLMVSTAVFEPL